ncbi:hypothetical protein BJ165DRAFT_1347319 [Panaeolus papilionaceus]|nr:hypothetical protein BJ165DRAFT_1347319 [Panaeolus papilionaceus]
MSTVAQSAEVNTHTGRPSSEQSRQKLTRPHLFRGATSHMESEYVHMVLALDDISVFYNIMAAFFTWILLAGFVLFPGTFANLQSAAAQHNLPTNSPIVLAAVNSITTLPLFVVASACAGMGIIGMLWLTWRWHKNYIWVLNKIFIPGLLNSLAGLLSTLANIYGTQKGEFSEPSRITLLVLICCSGVCLFLVVIYAFWLLRRIKSKHHVDVGVERSGKHGEGVTVDIEALKKKKNMREG